jgi:hypothetical protein
MRIGILDQNNKAKSRARECCSAFIVVIINNQSSLYGYYDEESK